jgi:hypothetical protein
LNAPKSGIQLLNVVSVVALAVLEKFKV